MLDKIPYKDVKKYKRYIPFDVNTNSRLYFDKDLMHKIFFYKTRDFDNILKKIDELKLEELVELKKLIYKNNFIVGYSIKNYKEYKSLNKYKNRKLKFKKQDCYKIVKAFDNLLKNNLSYVDLTPSNILLNKETNDIKICDLDSLILKDCESNKLDLKKLLIFILSYLYNINQTHIRNVLISGTNLENTFIESCKMSKENCSLEFINTVINDIRQEDIRKEKRLIIDRSKELIETGYPKFL